MKKKVFFFVFFLVIFEYCNAQTTKYYSFIHYVSTHLNPPTSVKENCEWQYALVKLQINKKNSIIDYSILNKVTNDLKGSFKFLKGYEFPQTMRINSRPIVFCVSILNEKSSCGNQKLYTPSETLGIIYSNLRPQLEADPNTIFIFDIVDLVFSSDPIK